MPRTSHDDISLHFTPLRKLKTESGSSRPCPATKSSWLPNFTTRSEQTPTCRRQLGIAQADSKLIEPPTIDTRFEHQTKCSRNGKIATAFQQQVFGQRNMPRSSTRSTLTALPYMIPQQGPSTYAPFSSKAIQETTRHSDQLFKRQGQGNTLFALSSFRATRTMKKKRGGGWKKRQK